jgi:23S rRNA (cytidine1920-2'-O)/16S rRNA (cytidine1409-2'-O)-methyltransferase
MPKTKKRLDVLLVERNLAESREKAQRLILAGLVIVEGLNLPKPGFRVSTEVKISLKSSMDKYVGRGGYKIEAALDSYDIDPKGMTCLDVGSSTGGFSDCLLQRGAEKVFAVDVGYGQLHYRLRKDQRVILMERVNARYLTKDEIPEPVDLVVIDVSFISLSLILPPLVSLIKPGAYVVPLIKPQFEAGRKSVPKGGVIKDPSVHKEVLERLFKEFRESGWRILDIIPSPVRGASGNREYLGWLERPDN